MRTAIPHLVYDGNGYNVTSSQGKVAFRAVISRIHFPIKAGSHFEKIALLDPRLLGDLGVSKTASTTLYKPHAPPPSSGIIIDVCMER
jgi:hypothetical protein